MEETYRAPNPIDSAPNEFEDETEPSIFSGKLLSLFIGALIVVVVVGAVFFALRQRATQKATQGTASVSPSPEPASSRQSFPSTGQSTTNPNIKTYTDNKFGYNIQMPNNWNTLQRYGNENAYQTAFYPNGSLDIPVTINSQPNSANITLDQWVSAHYGATYAREQKQIGGEPALLIHNTASYTQTYYVLHKGNAYEISGTTVRNDYLQVFNQIVSSFTFTN